MEDLSLFFTIFSEVINYGILRGLHPRKVQYHNKGLHMSEKNLEKSEDRPCFPIKLFLRRLICKWGRMSYKTLKQDVE